MLIDGVASQQFFAFADDFGPRLRSFTNNSASNGAALPARNSRYGVRAASREMRCRDAARLGHSGCQLFWKEALRKIFWAYSEHAREMHLSITTVARICKSAA
jgi:hypothetical protein